MGESRDWTHEARKLGRIEGLKEAASIVVTEILDRPGGNRRHVHDAISARIEQLEKGTPDG